MKNIKYILILLAVGFFAFNSGDDFRKWENNAFGLKEKCTYKISYGFVTAGIGVFSIPEMKTISGRQCYRVKFEVNSLPSFDWFFKVRDRYETYIDAEGIFPWRFERHIREGGFSNDFSAFFDHRKDKAITSGGEYNIPKYCHDIISAFFYFRTLDLTKVKTGDKIHLQNFYDDKVYDLDVLIRGRETIEVETGKYKCIVVEPLVKAGGLFKHDGDIIIWLSDDEVKIPIKMRTKIIIGYVNVEISAYEGLRNPITSKVN